MRLQVNQDIYLTPLSVEQAKPMFDLIDKHRSYLSTWLLFVFSTHSVEDVRAYILETRALWEAGKEHAFAIMYQDRLVGRITVQKIDREKQTAELAYWLAEDEQGKGIIIRCCETLIHYCFETLQLHCVQIQVDTKNEKSLAIPQKLNFRYKETRFKAKQMPDYQADIAVYACCKGQ